MLDKFKPGDVIKFHAQVGEDLVTGDGLIMRGGTPDYYEAGYSSKTYVVLIVTKSNGAQHWPIFNRENVFEEDELEHA